MTKKDYIKVAEIIKTEKENINLLDISAGTQAAASVELSIITGKLSDMFAQDNPRFDRAKFLQACGYND